jgi:antitoxin MazE
MQMRVVKWGDGLAVRLPADVVAALDLKDGDEIELRIDRAHSSAVSRQPNRQELLKRLHAFRGRLLLNWKFDREEATTR